MDNRRLLEKKSLSELREIAGTLGLEGYARLRKADLVALVLEEAASADDVDDVPAPTGAEHEDVDGAAFAGDSPDDQDNDASAGARSRERRRGRSGGDASGGDGDDDGGHDGGNDRGNDGGAGGGQNTRGRGGNGGSNDGDNENRRGRGGQPRYEAGEVREGVLDLLPEGYGFLRTSGYLTGKRDVYVSQSYVRRFALRRGDLVRGPIRANNKGSDKFPAIAEILEVEGLPLEEHQELERPAFDDLTAVSVADPLAVGVDGPLANRLVELVAPIALGHRVLVIGPRRSGRSTVLRSLARGVANQTVDAELIMLLVDARPEEVTLSRRDVPVTGVAAATFDRGAEDLVAVAELAVERAKRLVERGQDVVIVLDDMTSLGRAYEQGMQGGRGAAADGPHAQAKRFFAAARRIEEGGSLTIIAAATTATGMVGDEHQAEILLGAANVEIRLDAALARRRIHPAIDVAASGSHHEEELLSKDALAATLTARRALADGDTDRLADFVSGLKDDASTKDLLRAMTALG